jgi:hypothetical protein
MDGANILSRISIVSRFESVTQDGRHFECFRHLAFRGQFRQFDKHWYLEVTPTYRFTSDGQILDRFHEDRLKGIKRNSQHANRSFTEWPREERSQGLQPR